MFFRKLVRAPRIYFLLVIIFILKAIINVKLAIDVKVTIDVMFVVTLGVLFSITKKNKRGVTRSYILFTRYTLKNK